MVGRWMPVIRLLAAALTAYGITARALGQVSDTHPPTEPQLITSARLLKLGEEIAFTFTVPPNVTAGPLEVFVRYLETADPGSRFHAGRDLEWLDHLPRETLPVRVAQGTATVTYTPTKRGSYLAPLAGRRRDLLPLLRGHRGRLGGAAFQHASRTWSPSRPSTPRAFRWTTACPASDFGRTMRCSGSSCAYHRHFGESIIPALPDTPQLTLEQRLEPLRRRRGARAAAHARPEQIPGQPGWRCVTTWIRATPRRSCDWASTTTAGCNEANAQPWLGMPEFPYFSSPVDCRKVNQGPSGAVVAHQWDFCGGWHFIGPVSWHFKAADGELGARREVHPRRASRSWPTSRHSAAIRRSPCHSTTASSGRATPIRAFRYERAGSSRIPWGGAGRRSSRTARSARTRWAG